MQRPAHRARSLPQAIRLYVLSGTAPHPPGSRQTQQGSLIRPRCAPASLLRHKRDGLALHASQTGLPIRA